MFSLVKVYQDELIAVNEMYVVAYEDEGKEYAYFKIILTDNEKIDVEGYDKDHNLLPPIPDDLKLEISTELDYGFSDPKMEKADIRFYDWSKSFNQQSFITIGFKFEDFLKVHPHRYQYKQIIAIRKDLKMRRGKECAQVAHASMKATLENMDAEPVQLWLAGAFAKICVTVNSEQELLDLKNQAEEAGLITALIQDAGRTEFHNVPTYTTLAIGPDKLDKIDPVTEHLKLY